MINLEHLHNALNDNNPSQYKLAQEIGVNRGEISKWAKGKTNPSIENLAKIAIAKKVSTDFLLGLIEDKTVGDYSLKANENAEKLCFSDYILIDRDVQGIPLAFKVIQNILDSDEPIYIKNVMIDEELKSKIKSIIKECSDKICALYSKM